MTTQDEHGQARAPQFNSARLRDRSIDELIGLCRGILADGIVMQGEAQYLLAWLDSNRGAADQWPGNVIYPRVAAMLNDGVLDADEQAELLDLLNETTGMGIPLPEVAASYASALPLDDPPPDVVFPGSAFVLTGQFAQGSRKECEKIVTARGGTIHGSPTRRVHYLIVGAIGSRDWIHSTHGRKIEKAVDLKRQGHAIQIVSEGHWTKFL